ncbi:thioesterase family protein [Fodinicola feengrottensis]|uniref:Thioesterase family protein n=1 Tax=Fodinicola feengrottensis TaxID=435914 RepID=A0ABP4ULA8_9ACTN
MADEFLFPARVRYLEVDAQNVVFNMWYLGYFDEASYEYFGYRGVAYHDLIASGTDIQLVHSDLDYRSSVRWRDPLVVAVTTGKVGNTSFQLDFQARVGDRLACEARNVYVTVDTEQYAKKPVPDDFRAALLA